MSLAQIELESMFWGPVRGAPEEDPIGVAESFLLSGGVEPDEIEALFEGLSKAGLRSVTLSELTGERAYLNDEESRRLAGPSPSRPMLHQIIHITLLGLFSSAAVELFVLS